MNSKTLEILDERIKEILILNGNDININEHPDILKDAQELGLSQTDLLKRIRVVIVPSINSLPYNKIYALLEDKSIFVNEKISYEDVNDIIKKLETELPHTKVENYIRAVIIKREFKPREKKSPEADSFKNFWATNEAWIKEKERRRITDIVVEWLGDDATSIEQLGDISYKKTSDAKYYLRDAASIKSIVTTLTKSASKGDVYSKIIESEPNIDKRYLKVIYRLNPTLPFKITLPFGKDNREFVNINDLFAKTTADQDLFLAAANEYNKGHIHIWIKETDLANTPKLTTGYDYNSFLTFLLKINPSHCIYIARERFANPELLIAKAKMDKAYWYKIFEHMENGVLPVWFKGISKQEWLIKYDSDVKKFIGDFYEDEEEKKLASVQHLIQIIDPTVSNPKIKVSPEKISLLALEGNNKPVKEKINLALSNFGFIKTAFFIKEPVEGIDLSNYSATFFSLTNNISADFFLEINPFELVKDKLYSFDITVTSDYGDILIPVEVKVVFPKKAFILQMVKYAVFGAVFFGCIRAFAGLNYNGLLHPNSYDDYFTNNYAYFFALLLFIGGLIGSYFIIRKVEKI